MEPSLLGHIYLKLSLEHVQPGIGEEHAVAQTLKSHFSYRYLVYFFQ